MSILIIALPRTGSTEFGKRLSINNKFKYEFEPFNPIAGLPPLTNFKNIVLKTIIFQLPYYIKEENRINWLIELKKEFNNKAIFYHGNENKTHKFSECMPSFFTSDPEYAKGYGKFVKESVTEAKSDYEVYHKSYTSAINAAKEYAEKKGYEINDDDSFRQIGMGPRKPSEGKTNKFSIELSKDGKVQRKKLQIQVYGMRNSYELNAYIQ